MNELREYLKRGQRGKDLGTDKIGHVEVSLRDRVGPLSLYFVAFLPVVSVFPLHRFIDFVKHFFISLNCPSAEGTITRETQSLITHFPCLLVSANIFGY